MFVCNCRLLPCAALNVGTVVFWGLPKYKYISHAVFCRYGVTVVIRRLFSLFHPRLILPHSFYANGTTAKDGTVQSNGDGAQGKQSAEKVSRARGPNSLLDPGSSNMYKSSMSALMDQIRQAVFDSDKSRYRIAKETKIDQSALSRFVSGERGLPVDKLELVADSIGLEIIVRRKGEE